MGFRSYIRQFLVAILMLFRPSGPCCLSVAEPVSELGKLEDGYFSCLLNRSSKSRSSSSRRKKVAKIILFYGFQKLHSAVFGRNFDAFPSFRALLFERGGGRFLSLEIREFLVAILTLFRPSLPWCFPIRELSFEQKEQQEQEQQQQKEKVAKKSSFFLWVSEVTLGSFGRNFDAFPSFRALLFERGGGAVSALGNSHPGAVF